MSVDLGVYAVTDHQPGRESRGLESKALAGLRDLIALVDGADDAASGTFLAGTLS